MLFTATKLHNLSGTPHSDGYFGMLLIGTPDKMQLEEIFTTVLLKGF